MAHSIALVNADYSLDLLDSTAHKLLYGTDLSMPALEHFFGRPSGRDFDPLGSFRIGNRTSTLPVVMAGASMDNLIVNCQQVKAVLESARRFHAGLGGTPAYLAILPNGATNTTVFDVLEGQLNDGQFFNPVINNASAPTIYSASIRLTMLSYGRMQSLRRNVSGTITNGGGVAGSGGTYTITKPTSGEIPSAVRLEIAPSAANQRIIVAKVSRGDVSDIAAYWILQCEVSGGTGYTVTDIEGSANLSGADVVVAAANGGNVRRYTSTGADSSTQNTLRWTLTGPLASMRGRYRIFLRVDHPAQAGAFAAHIMTMKWGGSDGLLRSNTAVTLANVIDAVYDMGEIEMPMPNNDGTFTSFQMVLSIQYAFVGAAQAFDLDNLYLIPTDGELFDAEFTANLTASDRLISDHNAWHPNAYLTNSDGLATYLQKSTSWIDTGFTRSVENNDLYLVLMFTKSGSTYIQNLTHTFVITEYDYPRISLFDA